MIFRSKYGFLVGAVISGLITVVLPFVNDTGYQNAVEASCLTGTGGLFCSIFLRLFFLADSGMDGKKLLQQTLFFYILGMILMAIWINAQVLASQ